MVAFIGISWMVSMHHFLLAVPLLFLFALASAWLIIRLDAMPVYFKVLAFLLPFSIPVPFFAGHMVRIPAEPMLGLAVIMLPFFLLKEKHNHAGILYKEFAFAIPLVAVYIATSFFSDMLLVSLKFSFVNIVYILVFYVLLVHLYKKQPGLFRDMVILYGMGFLLVSLWSLYQFWQYDWEPLVMRGIFQPFYNDHTIFGASAAILTVLAIGMPGGSNLPAWRAIRFLPVLFFLMLVFYSTSRGAMLSLAVSLFVAIFLLIRPRPIYTMALLFVLTLGIYAVYPSVSERMQHIETLSYERDAGVVDRTRSVANITTDVSNVERLNRWVSAWRMFQERPLTGFGPGTYQFVYIPYQEERLMNRLTVTNPWDPPEGSGGTAHSEYLLLLSETGLFGLAAFLLLMGRWTWLTLHSWRFHPKRRHMFTALVALSTYFFHALVNNFLTTDKFAFLFWGTAAYLVASYHNVKETNETSHTNCRR